MIQAAAAQSGRHGDGNVDHVGLASRIDWEDLFRRGWDPDGEMFAPSPDDVVFGSGWCAAANCEQVAHHRGIGLCRRCQTLWETSPAALSFVEFCQTAPACTKVVGGGLCLVCRTPGHERPVRGPWAVHELRCRGTRSRPDRRRVCGWRRPLLAGAAASHLWQVCGCRMPAVGSPRRPEAVRAPRSDLGGRRATHRPVLCGVERPGSGAR